MAFAEDHREVLPVSRGFHSVDVEKASAAIVQECRPGHIAVGYLEEERRRLPFLLSRPEARGEDDHPPPVFLIRREPDGQQVPIIAPRQCRLVIVSKERARLVPTGWR